MPSNRVPKEEFSRALFLSFSRSSPSSAAFPRSTTDYVRSTMVGDQRPEKNETTKRPFYIRRYHPTRRAFTRVRRRGERVFVTSRYRPRGRDTKTGALSRRRCSVNRKPAGTVSFRTSSRRRTATDGGNVNRKDLRTNTVR